MLKNRHKRSVPLYWNYYLLSAVPIDFEYLQKETELPLPIIYTVILELELAGKAICHAGNKISLVYA
ncbi:hypothetical protein [Rickettsia asembonensis]|uniref:DprA-like winged helix domain-containing protein n=1 Tax=Rickettsia asembonensis TaxID=1068590 RepID=UPI001F518D72|nr:hypothetical protein [Rickettsia asembonensis]